MVMVELTTDRFGLMAVSIAWAWSAFAFIAVPLYSSRYFHYSENLA